VMLVSGGQQVPAGYSDLADGSVAIVSRDLLVRTHAL